MPGTPVRDQVRSDRRKKTAAVDIGPLDNAVGYLLRRAQLAIFDDFIRTFADLGLRPATFSVLVLIDRNPGLNQSEISAALGIQRTNFVAMIDGLETRGLARREPSPADRRSHALTLTPAGRELLAEALALHDRLEARLEEKLGPDGRNALISYARRIVQ
jgi:DNA-binding MarR family transcriptional regulator